MIVIDGDNTKITVVTVAHIDQVFFCTCSDMTPQFEVVIDQPTVSVRSGEDAQFECNARSHIEVESVNWTRYGDRLPPGLFFI